MVKFNEKKCYLTLSLLKKKVEDGNRAFNRSLLHLAASDGQGRSKSSRHNREFPHIRRIPRGGQTKTELCHSSATFVQILALGLSPTHHIVTGASKRGWATWLVGSVDPRVMAIVPVVMDELNFLDNIKHHYRSLGGNIPLVLEFQNPIFNILCVRLVICAGVLLENEPHIVLQRPCAGDSL